MALLADEEGGIFGRALLPPLLPAEEEEEAEGAEGPGFPGRREEAEERDCTGSTLQEVLSNLHCISRLRFCSGNLGLSGLVPEVPPSPLLGLLELAMENTPESA